MLLFWCTLWLYLLLCMSVVFVVVVMAVVVASVACYCCSCYLCWKTPRFRRATQEPTRLNQRGVRMHGQITMVGHITLCIKNLLPPRATEHPADDGPRHAHPRSPPSHRWRYRLLRPVFPLRQPPRRWRRCATEYRFTQRLRIPLRHPNYEAPSFKYAMPNFH